MEMWVVIHVVLFYFAQTFFFVHPNCAIHPPKNYCVQLCSCHIRSIGTCSPTTPIDVALPESCRGESRGVCLSKSNWGHRCKKCLDGWTWQYCLNPMGYDNIIWDPPETWSDLGFHWPSLCSGMVVMRDCGNSPAIPIQVEPKSKKIPAFRASQKRQWRKSECQSHINAKD